MIFRLEKTGTGVGMTTLTNLRSFLIYKKISGYRLVFLLQEIQNPVTSYINSFFFFFLL